MIRAVHLAAAALAASAALAEGDFRGTIAVYDRDAARLAAEYTNATARLDRPAEGVVVPLEQHEDGSARVVAEAERAQFFNEEGLVWCSGVTMHVYDEEGAEEMTLTAEACLYDKDARSCWCDGAVRGVRGGTTVNGRGFYFSFSSESDIIRFMSESSTKDAGRKDGRKRRKEKKDAAAGAAADARKKKSFAFCKMHFGSEISTSDEKLIETMEGVRL